MKDNFTYKHFSLSLTFLFFFLLLSPGQITAQISIQLSSQETLWVDANKCGAEGPRGAWLSHIVTNTGAVTLTDVEVTFAGFTGTNASFFETPSDLVREFSELAPGESVPVYWYVDYSEVCNNPAGGGTPYDGYTADYSVTVAVSNAGIADEVYSSSVITDELITASAAGDPISTTIGPGIFVGQLLTTTVVYSFGNNTDLFFQPAGDADFQDECIRLVQSEITAVSGGVSMSLVGMDNRLHFPSASVPGGGGTISVTYTWEVLCVNTAATINPWAAAKSGQKFKYTGFNSSGTLPMGMQAIDISKSVDPDFLATPSSDGGFGPGIVEWTVTLTNSANVDIVVNEITDNIPSCMTITNPTAPGSGVTGGNSASTPIIGSTNAVSWVGKRPGNSANYEYQVPANGQLDLVYLTDISSCPLLSTQTNSASATIGNTTVGPAMATVSIGIPVADLAITKNSTPDLYSPGGTITYDIVVSNNGPQNAAGVTVTDNFPAVLSNVNWTATGTTGTVFAASGSGDLNEMVTIPNGGSITYTVTADIDAGASGPLTNTATVSVPATLSDPNPDNNMDSETDLEAMPGFTVSKTQTGGPTTITAAGQVITYTIEVENTGNVNLTNVTAVETYPGAGAGTLSAETESANDDDVLEVGETWTYTATYTVTQADVDAAATLTNTITIDTDETDPQDATETTPVDGAETLTVTKTQTGGPATITAAGQVITYTIVVENTGTVSLTNVTAVETYPGAGAGTLSAETESANDDDVLEVGETWTYTATYTVTQADVDAAATLTNTITVDTDETDPQDATETTPVDGAETLTVTKTQTGGPATITAAGQVITYTITVENTGTVSLTNVTAVETYPGAGAGTLSAETESANDDDILEVGETWTYTATYTVTQADVDAATNLINTITIDTDETDPQDATETTPVDGAETLTVTKTQTGGPATITAAGQVITYTITVENTGTVSLTNVTAVETYPGAGAGTLSAETESANDDDVLEVGETWTYTATYTVTQADVDAAATLTNTITIDTDETDPQDATETTPVDGAETLTVTKTQTGGPTTITAAGQVITYTITVENTGTVSLTNVTAVETYPGAGAGTLSAETESANDDDILEVGETWTYTATYTVTQADVDAAATLTNTITIDTDETDPQDATETTPVDGAETLTVTKTQTGGPTTITAAGQVITYTITVENTGTVSLTNVTAVETYPGAGAGTLSAETESANDDDILEVGETWTYTATYTVTQADVDAAATLTNTITIDTDETDPQDATETTPVDGAETLTVTKTQTGGPATITAAGQVITYTITVENTGTVSLTNVTAVETYPGAGAGTLSAETESANDDDILEVGETWTYTATYTVTQADVDAAATLTNTITIDTDETDPQDATETTPVDGAETLTVTKTQTGGPATITAAGQVITYTITVENTGTVSLTNVTAVETYPGAGAGTLSAETESANDDDILEVGETWTYTATYTVTQADVDAATNLINTITIDTDETDPQDATETTPVDGAETLTVTKTQTGGPTTITAAGQVITYTIVVENTGTVSLTNVTAVETYPGAGAGTLSAETESANDDDILEVGETWTYTATYTVTQADVDAATPLTNTITVDTDETDPQDATETTPVDGAETLTVTKTQTGGPATITAAGQVITYTITVENTGTVSLTNVTAVETYPGAGAGTLSAETESANDDDILEVGETWTYTATYTVTQADVDAAATLTNTITVDTDETDPQDATETTPVDGAETLTVTKTQTGGPATITAAGQVITYTITVENTGTVSLTNVTAVETYPGAGAGTLSAETESANDDDILEVGETWTYTATYTVTQADVDAATNLINTITIDTDETDPQDATETTPVDGAETLTVTKTQTGGPATITAAGQVITYTITVENTGTVSLTNVTAVETYPGAGAGTLSAETESANDDDILEVGETWTYTATYTVTQADVDAAATLTNTITIDTDETDPQDATETTPVDGAETLTVTKTQTGGPATITAAGQVITYTITVENTGTVSLTNVTAVETYPGAGAGTLSAETESANDDDVLEVGETWTYTATYTVTQADVDAAATLTNTITIDTDETDPQDATETTPVDGAETLTVTKTQTGGPATITAAGQVITYTITVENTGTVSLTNVTAVETYPGAGAGTLSAETESANDDDVLEVGETWTYTATYTVTQADVDAAATLTNTITVDTDETDPQDATETTPVDGAETLTVTKTQTGGPATITAAGQVITYTITVENTGTVSLTNVTAVETYPGAGAGTLSAETESANDDDVLEVGETWTYTATYTVTQADVDAAATLVNTITVDTEETDPEEDTEETPVDGVESFTVSKTQKGGPATVTAAGQTITYTIVVENTGTVSLTGVTAVETYPGAGAGTLGVEMESANDDDILEVGETWTYTATYTVTQADVDAAATLVNTITVDTEETDPEEDTEETPVDGIESFTVSKTQTGGPATITAAGQTITYTIEVENTGTVSLTGVSAVETYPGAGAGILSDETESANDDDILEVGETWTYTATYTVTQADVDAAATLVNTITVDVAETDPEEDTEETPVDGVEALTIEKTNNSETDYLDNDMSGDLSVGDEITYTYTVENTGTVTLSNVTVADDLLGTVAISDNGGDGASVLAPGAIESGTLSYVIASSDLGTTITNIVTADSEQSDPDEDTNEVEIPEPSIDVVKSNNSTTDFADNDGNGYVSVGDEITYTYTVTNNGTATLTGVTVIDDLLGPVTITDLGGNGVDVLAPEEVETGTLSYVIQTSDVGTTIRNVVIADSDQSEPATDVNLISVVNFVCKGNLNVTLNENCMATLTLEALGFTITGNLTADDILIIIEDADGNVVSTDGSIPGPGIYNYIIQIKGEDESKCWGTVTAEDNTLPTLDCPAERYEVNGKLLVCTDVDLLLLTGVHTYKVDKDGILTEISDELKAILDLTGYPTISDNCKGTTVYVSDELLHSEACEDQTIVRTFRIEEEIKGLLETESCTQEIHFGKPSISDVEEPLDAAFTCTDEFKLDGNGNPHPDETGYPQVVTGLGTYDLAPEFCNLGASYRDGERIVVCEGTYKVIRHWQIIDWCAEEGERSRDFTQIIKVEDVEGPTVVCETVDYDNDGYADLRTYSTGPYDCTAAFAVPMPAVTDDCSGWSVLTEIVSEGVVIATILPDANRYISGIPTGCHVIRYTVTDGCGNTTVEECPFQVLDQIAPIAACNEGLNISLGGQNFGRIAADRIDEGSRDNCGPIRIEVRRRILNIEEYACLDMFDYNNNGLIIGDEVNLTAEFGDPDGDGAGDLFYYTPWADYADFNCCDMDANVRIELRVWDDANGSGIFGDEVELPVCYDYETQIVKDNYNVCWMDVLIEDKVPPVCTPPLAAVVDCNELPFDFDPQNEVQMTELFGAAEGYDNCWDWTVAELDADVNLDDCGSGSFTRRFQVTDTKGNQSQVCEQLVTVRQVNDYWIKFPADAVSSCGILDPDTLEVSEGACDLLAISVKDDIFPASGDECYTIFRTFSVINWCEYDGISDPVKVGRDEDCDGRPGDEDVYVIVKTMQEKDPCYDYYGKPQADHYEHVWYDRDNDPFNTFPEAGTKKLNCDYTTNPTGFWKELTPITENDAEDDDLDGYPANGQNNCEIASTGYWQYRQVIKVKDEIDPVVVFTAPDAFCSYSSDLDNDCPAEVTIDFQIDENCTPDDLSIQVFLDADADGVIDADITSQLTGTYPDYQVTGTFPLGQHEIGISVTDGCGNQSGETISFEVIDCKAPSPICISGLAVELMPVNPVTDVDDDGDDDAGAMSIWASDFIASTVTDCSGEVTYSINRVGEPNDENQTGLTLTCDDDASVLVEIWAYDAVGNADFCETYVLVQDNMVHCGGGEGAIAGTVMTEEGEAVEGATIELSGGLFQAMVTKADGGYRYDELETGFDYTVTPEQDILPLNGVSTFDLVLMSKHILGTEPLDSPYKRIAADINKDKRITALDAIELRRLILNINIHFEKNTSWRFIPADYVFPNPENPWLEEFPEVINVNDLQDVLEQQDFVATKIGDVNLTARPNLLAAQPRTTSGTFLMNVEEQALKAGNEYRIDFRADQLPDIQGYQFTLALDPSVALVDIEYGIAQSSNFGLRLVGDGLITTSWNKPGNDAGDYEQDDVLFSLIVKAVTDGKLSEVLGISSRITVAEAYDQHDGLLQVGIDFQSGIVATVPFELYQNVPNPFHEATSIGFFLPEAAETTISIHDAGGRIVKMIRSEFNQGENQVILKRTDLPDTGMLYYTVTSGEHTATRKMILVK